MTSRRGLFHSTSTASVGWNPLSLAALGGLWLAVLPNWPLWHALLDLPETHSLRGAVFMAGFGLIIASFMTALLALTAWRPTIRIAISAMLLAAAFGAHFMGSYGVVIDTTMMTNVLQTDAREVRDLLNLRLALNVFVLAVLPMIVVWRVRIAQPGPWRQLGRNALGFVGGLLLVAALVFALFADLSTTMRNHKSMRYLINPVNSLYALIDLGVRSKAEPPGPPQPIGLDAKALPRAAGARPPLVLLVVGETARADHFALNGYPRATDPELTGIDLASYTDVTSCGTNTAASLPCMFSALGKTAFEARKSESENLLDLVQRAGYAVLWLDNQAGCKGLCDRVPHADASTAPAGTAPLPAGICNDGECLDEALLTGLQARLDALPDAARGRGVLIVLHQMGSHGPAYFKRSPPDRKPFLPECTTSVLQQCDHAAMINAYDNSIAYTDHVLSQAVKWLQGQARYDTAMLYLSDHGESLGENGLYLHGLPYAVAPREQKHVPWITWVSPQTQADAGPSMACLRSRRTTPLSHDNLFHSVLGLLGIRASEYRSALDAFAACRKP